MSVVYTETWKSEKLKSRQRPSDQIHLTFHLTVQEEGSSWYVVLSSERHKAPVDTTLPMPLDEVLHLNVRLPDELYIQGTLLCHQLRSNEFLVETEQLEYGFLNDRPSAQSLLGTVVKLSAPQAARPVPPLPPVSPVSPVSPVPLPPPPDESQAISLLSPTSTQDEELFPYVYLRLWPEPSTEELARQFIRYPFALEAPPSGEFLQRLVSLRRSEGADVRDQMEQLAVSYIEGREETDLPFVKNPRTLPAPWSAYPEIYRLASRHEGDEPARVVAELWTVLGLPWEQVAEQLGTDAYHQTLTAIWQSYFALVIEAGDKPRLREELVRLLVVDHLLRALAARRGESLSSELWRTLRRATPVLPGALFPLPPEGTHAVSPPADVTSRIVFYAIGELQMVRQRFRRYGLGELARVENLMAGEWRKSVRRSARSAMQESASQGMDETEHSHSARSRTFTSELTNAIADMVSTTTYGAGDNGFNVSYGSPGASGGGPVTTRLNGGWQLNTGPAVTQGEPSKTEVSRAAQQLVQRAADRVAHRVVEERSTRTTSEAEETSISVLDNKRGTKGRQGLYRWLNEVYEARIVQYGNRFVLEFLLSAPAAPYLRAQEAQPGDGVPPVPPAAIGIESFEDISRHNFPALVARYPSASLDLPPGPRTVSGWARSDEPLTLALAEGYIATSAHINCVVPAGHDAFQLQGMVGQTPLRLDATGTNSVHLPLNRESGQVQVLLNISGPPASPPVTFERVQLTVDIESVPGEELMNQWRLGLFRALHAVYTAQLRAYQGASTSEESDREGARPRYSDRAIERGELKRAAFELLSQVRRERVGTEDVPSLWPGQVDVSLPRYLQFFERAFEWGEMSYTFIPGMRGPGASAGGAARADVGDARFIEFLEAAYAQVLVPVGMSESLAVLYFLASGVLWSSGGEWVPVHETHVALASELKTLSQEHRVPRHIGEPWEIVVPTTFTVLQEGEGVLWGTDTANDRALSGSTAPSSGET